MSNPEFPDLNETESEPTLSTEVQPLSEDERQLLEALTYPKEIGEAIKRTFARAVALELDETERLKMQAVTDYLSVAIFGGEMKELPSTLIWEQRKNGTSLRVQYSLDIPLYRESIQEEILLRYLREKTDDLMDEGDAVCKSRKETIVATLANILRTDPQYTLFSSFLLENPEDELAPLSPYWRQIRKNQTEEATRQDFGLPPDTPIPHRSPAEQTLRRAQYGIDDESMPDQATKGGSAYERLNTWFISHTDALLPQEAQDEGEYVVQLFMLPGESARWGTLMVLSSSGAEYEVDDVIFEWSVEICKNERLQSLFPREFSDENLAAEFIRAFYAQGSEQDVPETLETALHYAAETEYIDCEGDFSIELLSHPPGSIYAYLPEKPPLPKDFIHHPDKEDVEQMSVISRQHLENLRNRVEGRVLYRDSSLDVPRLIMLRNRQGEPHPEIASEPFDLAIKMESQQWSNDKIEPYVLGFRIVAQKNDTWHFVRDTDPYLDRETVIIEPENLNALCEKYKQIGLTALAQELSSMETVSVLNLQNAIKAHSNYTFDESLEYALPDQQLSLEDFTLCVKEGKLQTQCTGSATFCALSLEVALPDSYAGSIRGYVLQPVGSKINDVAHAQTLLSHSDRKYILDACPPAPMSSNSPGESLTGWSTNQELPPFRSRHEGLSDKPARKSRTSEYSLNPNELIKQFQEANLPIAQQRLEHALIIAFQVHSRDELYAHMVTLKNDDPIRRALESMVRYTGDDTEIKSTKSYLSSYIEASPSDLKLVGLPLYSPELLTIVKRALL